MKKDPFQPDKPLVDTNRGCCLGARTIGNHADIQVDQNGYVIVNGMGISVSADWRTLLPHLIPIELDDGNNGASGKGMEVFVHGSGAFDEGPATSDLEMCYKNKKHHRRSCLSGWRCATCGIPTGARFHLCQLGYRPELIDG